MTSSEIHDYEEPQVSFGDFLISGLTALTFAGVAWGVVYGVMRGILFGLAAFEITWFDSGWLATAFDVAFVALPILMALFVLWKTYNEVLEME